MMGRSEHHRRRRILAIAKSLARADIARWPNWSRIPAGHRAELVRRAAVFSLEIQRRGYRVLQGNYGPGRGPRNPVP